MTKYYVKTWDEKLTKQELIEKGISHTTFQKALKEGWIEEADSNE